MNSVWFYGMAALCGGSLVLATATRSASQEQKDVPAPVPAAVRMVPRPPEGAVVLFASKAEDITSNWLKRYSKDPATWTLEEDGAMKPVKSDITSKQEFGDCFLHVEFKCPAGHGNAGVALQGRYEVQIYNSFGHPLDNQTGAAFYSQKAAKHNAAKPEGAWQSYDILFRSPRFDAEGKVTEKARASVFWNGVLVQNNEEFNGPTGIQYGEFKGEAKTGPIILQGDHDVVQYKNVWVIPQ